MVISKYLTIFDHSKELIKINHPTNKLPQMWTKEEIISEICIEVPFTIPENIKPYIYAAMGIYANQFKCSTTTELFKEVHVDLMIKSNEIFAKNSHLSDSQIKNLPEYIKVKKAMNKIEREYF